MSSDVIITAIGLAYAAVALAIAAGVTTVAAGVYDSIVTGDWTPGYIVKRDIGVGTKNLHPGLGNRLEDEYLKVLDDPDHPRKMSASQINQSDAIAGGLFVASLLSGAAGASGATGSLTTGAVDTLGNTVAGASLDTAATASQLGSEIGQATFQSVDAFNKFHQPFTELAKSNLQNMGSVAIESGAAAGQLSVGMQGGNPGLEAMKIAQGSAASTADYAKEAVQAPVQGFAKVGPALKAGQKAVRDSLAPLREGLTVAKDSIALPFEKLGEVTHPMIGRGAQSIAKNVSTSVLNAAGTDEDLGDAALIGAAGGLGSLGVSSLLSGSRDLAHNLKTGANHPMGANQSTVNPLRAKLGGSLAGLNAKVEGLGGDIPRAALAKALRPEPLPYQVPEAPFSYATMFPGGNKAYENRAKRFPSIFKPDLMDRLNPYRRRV